MKTIIKSIVKHNNKKLIISREEYLDFKIGDKYFWRGNDNGYRIIANERERDLANRIAYPKFYLEVAGGKHLVIETIN